MAGVNYRPHGASEVRSDKREAEPVSLSGAGPGAWAPGRRLELPPYLLKGDPLRFRFDDPTTVQYLTFRAPPCEPLVWPFARWCVVSGVCVFVIDLTSHLRQLSSPRVPGSEYTRYLC